MLPNAVLAFARSHTGHAYGERAAAIKMNAKNNFFIS
jgi:hypothetical protein